MILFLLVISQESKNKSNLFTYPKEGYVKRIKEKIRS